MIRSLLLTLSLSPWIASTFRPGRNSAFRSVTSKTVKADGFASRETNAAEFQASAAGAFAETRAPPLRKAANPSSNCIRSSRCSKAAGSATSNSIRR